MKKASLIFVVFLSLFSSQSCSKEENLGPHLFPGKLPGKYGGKIASDSKGSLWLTTSEIDTTIQMPAYSSSIPIRIYLTKHYNDSYEVYDNKFMGARDIITDKYDRLWFISRDKVYLLENNKYSELYKIGGDKGYFEWITIDKQSNIWVGGWQAPLLRITLNPEIKINNLSNNSTETNTSAGCFDNDNNLWVILGNSQIGMRDNQGRWTVYTPDNSQLPYQSFWSITADNENNIWAGTGFSDSKSDLMKFDGTKWESVTIRDDKGNPVFGTVRQLYSHDNKIWIVTEFTSTGAFESNYLITFDGFTWNRIYDVPPDDGITDLAFDSSGNRALIGTMNKGLFEVGLN